MSHLYNTSSAYCYCCYNFYYYHHYTTAAAISLLYSDRRYLYIIVLLHNNNNNITYYVLGKSVLPVFIGIFSLLFSVSEADCTELIIRSMGWREGSGRRHDSFAKPVASYPITSRRGTLLSSSLFRYILLYWYTKFCRSRPRF